MPRLTYIAELTANSITHLAWAAGFAAGAGNQEAAEGLQDVLASIQLVELPDMGDLPADEQPLYDEAEDALAEREAEDNVVEMEGYRAPDPMFTPPPPPPGPINDPKDFGAGPPPAGGIG